MQRTGVEPGKFEDNAAGVSPRLPPPIPGSSDNRIRNSKHSTEVIDKGTVQFTKHKLTRKHRDQWVILEQH